MDGARRSVSDRPRSSEFAKLEKSQPVGFETVLSLTRASSNRRPSTRQVVAEHSGNGRLSRGWRRSTTIVVKEGVRIRDERRRDEAPRQIVTEYIALCRQRILEVAV